MVTIKMLEIYNWGSPNSCASSTDMLNTYWWYLFLLFYRRRDVERDNFVLNETPLSGSNGFDFILDTVIDQLRALAQDLVWWCQSIWPLQQFACLILRAGRLTACCLFGVLPCFFSIDLLMISMSNPPPCTPPANRTESGGKGFDALRQSLASLSVGPGISASEALLIVPSSMSAEPLHISLSSGVFERSTNDTGNQFDIGLYANIEVHVWQIVMPYTSWLMSSDG